MAFIVIFMALKKNNCQKFINVMSLAVIGYNGRTNVQFTDHRMNECQV